MKNLKSIASAGLVAFCISANATPMTLQVKADWPTNLPFTVVEVLAQVESQSQDRDAWDRIGSYRLQSLIFTFSRLGSITTEFSIRGDLQQSALDIYPSYNGGLGEIRIFGQARAEPMPNGILPGKFDLRLYFEQVETDELLSVLRPLNHIYGSLYLDDQIGARSDRFTTSEVVVSIAAVPEPNSFALVALALFACVGVSLRTNVQVRTR